MTDLAPPDARTHPPERIETARLVVRRWGVADAPLLRDATARLPGLPRIEIRCDPLNVRSAAVARRLDFRHERTMPAHEITIDGTPRDTMVWVRP